MNQNSLNNLVPFTERSKEEHLALSAKGGRNAAKKRAEAKSTEEMIEKMLSAKIKDKDVKKSLKESGFDSDEYNYLAQLLTVMYAEGLNGNTKAIELILANRKQTQQVVKEDEEDSVADMIHELKSRKVSGVDDE